MKVKSLKNVNPNKDGVSCNPHLTPQKQYWVIGIDDENYRIVNDSYEPVLYPKVLFEVIDPSYPDSWIKEEFDDGEYFIDPPEFAENGFYEKLFDGDDESQKKYASYLKIHGIKP